ncbi:MAG TPA: HlyC/CorC family transporter [Candidatus Coatesbacteria bacterium]|nr:HlyC/CorC family transporter [Candidatus Coatesbacteria bacterium]
MTGILWLEGVLCGLFLLVGLGANLALSPAGPPARRTDEGRGPSRWGLRLFPVLLTLSGAGAVITGASFLEMLTGGGWSVWLAWPAVTILVCAVVILIPHSLGGGGHRFLRGLLWPLALAVSPVWLVVHLVSWPVVRLIGRKNSDNPFGWVSQAQAPAEAGDEVVAQAREMARQLADFPEKTVKEVMVPRIDVFCLDTEAPRREVVEAVTQRGHSRVPVYSGTIDDIRGILFVKELLILDMGRGDEPIPESFLHEPIFVPETKLIGKLLADFQATKNQIAVVVDEYGGTAGIVTLEDILEEIVGEISDEFDDDEELIHELEDGAFLVDARCDIEEVNEAVGCALPDEDYESLGGFIIAELGHIPKPGETVEYGGHRLEVVEATPRRIRTVRLTPLPEAEENDED